METNEIMTNEEIKDATEDVIVASSDNGSSIGIMIGVASLAGVLSVIASKYVVKAGKYVVKDVVAPIIAKIKAKKEQHEADSEDEKVIQFDPDSCEEDSEK